MQKPCPEHSRRAWTTRETALLKQHYPQGGSAACLPHLPGRTPRAIGQQAMKLGIRTVGRKRHRPIPTNEHIDNAIRAAYASGETGRIKRLSQEIDRPYGWVKYRAAILGCRTMRLKEPNWTAEELALLERYAGNSLGYIHRIFCRAGFARSLSALRNRLYGMGLDTTDPDTYTANQLAALFGIDSHVVIRWINQGWLKARKAEHMTFRGESNTWRIRRQDLRTFIRDNPQRVNLKTVDRFWFIELMAGPVRVEKIKEAG